MSLLDLVVPSKKVVIHQKSEDHPEVVFDVFGLTTEDFAVLAEQYTKILTAIFLKNAKEDLAGLDNSKLIMREFPVLGAACIAHGCKQPEAVEHVRNLPILTQVELLSAVFELTFPDGLKKSLEKLAPTIALLLRK